MDLVVKLLLFSQQPSKSSCYCRYQLSNHSSVHSFGSWRIEYFHRHGAETLNKQFHHWFSNTPRQFHHYQNLHQHRGLDCQLNEGVVMKFIC